MTNTTYGSITITNVSDGQTFYTWYIYADDANGTNATLDSVDKEYMGVASNQATPLTQTILDTLIDFSIFSWSQISIKVTGQTEQYYKTNSKNTPSSEDSDWLSEEAWVETMPNPWEGSNGTKYYIWKRQKTFWSNDTVTYVGLQLISDYDVATSLAKQVSMEVGAWCKENNITIIDGATIMTGTIHADKIEAGTIGADKLSTDAITSRNYYKQDAEGKYTTELSGEGAKLNLADGTWDSANFKIGKDGSITATKGTIGGLTITGISNTITQTSADAQSARDAAASAATSVGQTEILVGQIKDSVSSSENSARSALEEAQKAAASAGEASVSAGSAATNAAIARTDADNALASVGKAEAEARGAASSAAAAQEEATKAATSANAADQRATQAETQAAQANTNAANAVEMANSANAQSASAVQTAQSANETATAANTSATEAKQAANNAVGTANNAKSVADAAVPRIATGDYSWTFDTSDGIIMNSGNVEVFRVGQKNDESGLYMIGNGKFTGKVTAGSGNIGGWTIAEDGLYSEDGEIFLSSDGIADENKENTFIVLKAGENFKVATDGTLYATNGSFAGNITGSTITGSSFVIKDNNENVQFSVTDTGELTANKGSVAGWTINTNSLIKGNFGEDDSIHLYPDGYDTSDASVSNEHLGQTGKKWMLTIGSNFGVDSEGNLYATGGQIGGLTIESVKNTIDQTSADAQAAKENADACATLAESAAASADSAKASVSQVQGSVQAAEESAAKAEADALTAQGQAEQAKADAEQAKKDAEDAANSADSAATSAGEARTLANDANTNANTAVNTANIAKGTADEAQQTANNAVPKEVKNKNYNWLFSPDNGIIMKSGNNEVFKVGEENGELGLHMKGNGEFTGTITAKSGKIGNWSIAESTLALKDDSETVVLDPSGKTSIDSTKTGLVFKAGNDFGVTKGGKLYATGADISGKIVATEGSFSGHIDAASGSFSGHIEAEEGQIANFNIVGNRLTSGNGDGFVNLQSAKYPQDYILAEYIESSGTQYIDTGVYSANNITIEVDTQLFSTTSVYGSNTGYRYTAGTSASYFYYFYSHDGNNQGYKITPTSDRTVIKQEDNICYRDGTSQTSFVQKAPYKDSYSIFLFASNNKGSKADAGRARIYSCRIWEDGELIRNFVPVYRNNEFCMYETCYGQYYTNKGTGVFNGVPKADAKDTFIQNTDSYQVLEYIEGFGTQYINTGFDDNNSNNLKIEAKFSMQEFSQYAGVFGNYVDEPYSCWRLLLTNADSSNGNYWVTTNRRAGGSTPVTIPKNTINDIIVSKDKIVINSVLTPLTNSDDGIVATTPQNIVIFAQAEGHVCAKMRLYEFRIYDNGTQVRNYIPVLKNGSEYGLYDLVTKTFYGNNGTGAFTGAELTDEFSAIYLGAPTPEDAPFSVTNTGKLKAESGTIAGWTIDSNKLTSGTIGENGSFGVFPKGILSGLNASADESLASGDAWVMTAGSKFGVTRNGALYATNANISGTITAESGKIAGWEINNSSSPYGPSITFGTLGAPGSFHMYSNKDGLPGKILNKEITNANIQYGNKGWVLGIGENFGVTANGELYAYRGNIAGIDVSVDNLTWTKNGSLVSLLSGTLTQGTARSVGNSGNKQDWFLWTNGGFGVDSAGKLYATGADISGTIKSTSGQIGGWVLRDTSLIGGPPGGTIMGLFTNYKGLPTSTDINATMTNTSLKVGNSGSQNNWRILIGNSSSFNFGVDGEGKLYATAANISGTITADGGKIADWTLKKTDGEKSLSSGTIGSNGVHFFTSFPNDKACSVGGSDIKNNWRVLVANKFGVDSSGNLYTTGGKIGGWEITENGIEKRNEEGTPIIGMVSGNRKYLSLVQNTDTVEGSFTPVLNQDTKYVVPTDFDFTEITTYQFNKTEGISENYCYANIEEGKIVVRYMFVPLGGTTPENPTITYSIKAKRHGITSPLRFYAQQGGTFSQEIAAVAEVSEKGVFYNLQPPSDVLISHAEVDEKSIQWSEFKFVLTKTLSIKGTGSEIYPGAGIYQEYYEDTISLVGADKSSIKLRSLMGLGAQATFTYENDVLTIKYSSINGPIGYSRTDKIEVSYVPTALRANFIYENNWPTKVEVLPAGSIKGTGSLGFSIKYFPANYQLLEDGSLYAGGASIRGAVYANDGFFQGELNATSGCFEGVLKSNSASLGCFVIEDTGMTAEGHSTIIKPDEIVTSTIKGISGAELNLAPTMGTVDIGVRAQIEITDYGEKKINGDISEEGKVVITINADKVATEDLTFEVEAEYIYFHLGIPFGEHSEKRVNKFTLPINKNTVSFTIPYLISSMFLGSSFGSSGFTLKTHSFDSATIRFVKTGTTITQTKNQYTQIKQSETAGYTVLTNANIVPTLNTGRTIAQTLGASTRKWNEIWSHNALNTASDKNIKNSIEKLPESYSSFFDELCPVRYRFNENNSNRYHIGLISQEVGEALRKTHIPTSDFAGYLEYEKEDGTKGYGLRYGEFIALNINEIQKLKPRVSSLEETILEYETRISNLENQLKNLTS